MTDQSIFDEGEGSQNQPESTSNDTPSGVDQLLAGIVNAEGKQKYASIEEALKGAAAAQEHISRLETENTQFKQKVEKSTTLQDVLEAMKPREDNGEEVKSSAPELNEDMLAQLLEKVVEKKESETAKRSNAQTVAAKFKELHGEDAEAKYLEAAASVGMSKAQINSLAASNPTAVFKLLGVDTKQEVKPSGLSSSVNPSTFQQKPNEMPKFDPMRPAKNAALEKWRASAKITNERLGLDN